MDRDEIMRVLRALQIAAVEYVLIGAATIGLHDLLRATEDLDLFIRTTAKNVERLRSALRAVYSDDPHINEISSDDLRGERARRQPNSSGYRKQNSAQLLHSHASIVHRYRCS